MVESTHSVKPGRDDGAHGSHQAYVLRLFVAGMTARSTRAVENIRAICEEHFAGAYELEVVNLYEQPARASGEQIIAAPTCVKELPLPARRVIGDMSNTARVLEGLDLVENP
jgi:circadian clock protein KaiB